MKRSDFFFFISKFSVSALSAKALLFFFFLLLSGSVTAQPSALTFVPQWIPQAQFAGYYVALDQGFYEEAGLDVTIRHPRADISAMSLLKSGEADIISSFLMDGITERLKGNDLVNIAQLSQHSSMLIVTKEESGIDQLDELNRKKIAIWSSGFDLLPRALMRERDIDAEFVPVLNTINLFLVNGVDAMTVMYYNEYDQIINSGVNKEELNTFFFSDFEGFDVPEDGLYCLESTYQWRKADLKKFVSATFKGWEYARKHKDYAINLVVEEMNKAHLPNNKAHQRWMLDKVLELIVPGEKEVDRGKLLEQDYYRTLNIIKSSKDTSHQWEAPQLDEFYKPLVE